MKRAFAFLLALAMVLSLSVATFAAGIYTKENLKEKIVKTGSDGKITITNATKEKEYTVYKIFDATIKTGDGGVFEGINYTIDPTSAAFQALFGNAVTPTSTYFTYNPSSHAVTKKDTVENDKDLIDHLAAVVRANPSAFPHVAQKATGSTLVFDELLYGYYLIDREIDEEQDAAVTIDSNTPEVDVIDKNQSPGGFDKKLEGANPDKNTVNVGDVITYNISFTATNYSGDEKIKYYEVFDVKGTGIWAEFNSFTVTINGESKPGYYLNKGGLNTNGWAALGEWGSTTPSIGAADWYLVHTGFDTYSILIPWLEGHTVTGVEGHQVVNIDNNANSKYTSPASVVIRYTAAIEPNADIGGAAGSAANLYNEAYLSWVTKDSTGKTPTDKVTSETFGIAIKKEDLNTHTNLAGAKFRVWRDYNSSTKTYADPVYVIPTGIDGIYAVDSAETAAENVSGTYMDTAREYYDILRYPDGKEIKDGGGNTIPNTDIEPYYQHDEHGNRKVDSDGKYVVNRYNNVESQVNGKLVILGLAKDTYYLEEYEAPDGYNALTEPVTIEITDTSSKAFKIFANPDGTVVDRQDDNGGTYLTYMDFVTQETVGNSKGHELPSTGGEGRIRLMSFGAMIAIGFAVLLITQKKMSGYRD